MEHIWSPWRYKYLASLDKPQDCVFCIASESNDDRKHLVIHRARFNYVILNRFPYTSGHLMVVPYEHVASLPEIGIETSTEMLELAKHAQKALDSEYHPDGYNIGMNLGSAAGAGVAGHIHLHVVPRWAGDANFVSIVGETRVLPEELEATFDRLRAWFSNR